jgi:hypothetical protein
MLPPMPLLHLARTAGLAAGVGLVASACGAAPAPPQAYVLLQMSGDSPAAQGNCPGYSSDTTLMQIGMAGNPNASPMPTPPTRVATGAQHIAIACSVHQEGDSFAVNLQIAQGNVAGTGSTTLTVDGMVSASAGGTNVTSDVSNTNSGDFHSTACTITFDTSSMNGTGAQPSTTPIAPGRIWAHLSCPADTNMSVTTGSGGPAICDAEVDFIFENCGT